MPAVIIPNDKGGVFARAVEGKFYRNNNPTATTTLSVPHNEKFDIVIVEGAINGASILQALGFNPAFNAYPKFGIIASGGTSGNKHVLEQLQELKNAGKKIRVLIAYDNDSHKKGQIAAEKLLSMLKKSGFIACIIDITKTPDFDLNDVLRGDEGKKKLAEMVNSAVTLAQDELEKAVVEVVPVADSDSTDKDKNSAKIEELQKELQEVQKEQAAFDAEKESAIEKLRNVENFDFDTCFSAEIVKGAAFAKLYSKEVYARACVDIQAANDKEKFLRNWQGAVKEMEGEISSRAAKLNYRIAQIKSQIAALKFSNDNSEIMQGLEFPIGFSVSSAGEIVKTTKEGEITICRAPVVIAQKYFGVDTNFYKWQLAIKKLGKWQLIPPLEQATLAVENKLILAVSNFGLPVNSVNSGGVVDYLDAFLAHNEENFPTTYTARQFGWNNFNGKDFFLDPRRNCTVEVDGVNCPFVADSTQSQFAKSLINAGSLDVWKELYFKVKKFPLARFIVAACFAAPLLKILSQRNFLLYIYGKTRAGKTTALLLGISGIGSEKMLRTFDATKNGLIGAALEANDYVFAVDEKQAADKRIVEQMHNLIYSFGNGTERVKLRRDSSLREVREWRGVGVMTGETPLTDDNVT
ncbi:MAG: DUF927 domain-containing protein, partial [Selenomonadaceae bacterium]|nr:DUF927 domain-containing protein [Selenomonadaceae bacterium]